MEVVGPDRCVPPPQGSAVTIGAYDGVHLGHRHLLRVLTDAARRGGLHAVVVTFDRHPASVVRPESAPAVLTDLDQKLELLAAAGIDRTYVVPFDEERSKESAEIFVSTVLVASLSARVVVVGQDFHFGHGRSGNTGMLAKLGALWGFETEVVMLADADGVPVSSTRIRRLLADGDVAGAAVLLGRAHQVRGTVVHGDGRGAQLGFPTANIDVAEEIALPAEGIYAGRYMRPDGTWLSAAVSVGRRPTFYQDAPRPLLEAHLLDFDANLYGEPARLSFVARVRDERRFDTAAALAAQMRSDVEVTRALLG
jgi:riboflavin kinase/FMN adenylyltransferase